MTSPTISMSSDPNRRENCAPGSSHAHQQPGRRAACDRCRGQKLRCLREPQPGNAEAGKCIRCNTAGAVCSFSQSKRAGRPPASATSNPTERKARGSYSQGDQASGKQETPSAKRRESLSSRKSFEDLVENQYGGNEPGKAIAADEPFTQPFFDSSVNETSWDPVVDMPWIDDRFVPSYDGGYLSSPTSLDSFIQDYHWNVPLGIPGMHFAETQPPDFITGAATTQVLTGDNLISDTMPSMLGPRASNPPMITQSHPNGEESMDVEMADFASMSGVNTNVKGDSASVFSPPSDDDHHSRMQELSELAINLYSQVIANEDSYQTQVATSSIVPDEKLAGDLLKSSSAFLKILSSFYPSAAIKRPRSKASTVDSSDGDFSPSETSIFSGYSDVTSATTASSSSEWAQNYQRKRSTIPQVANLSHDSPIGDPESGPPRPIRADMTTILQLLTCYIRVIHLHSIFYIQVHDSITGRGAASTTTNTSIPNPPPTPPMFPGMHVGSLSLDDFPNFQIKLLLQISTHLLSEIEKALGLPDGYRISRKGAAGDREEYGGRGILEVSVSAQFVEMTMRENVRTGSAGKERDRIRSIRDTLARLRVLLKGTINI